MQLAALPATVWFLLLPLIGPRPGGVCYQSVKGLIVERNRHLKSDNNLSRCTLHTHLHTHSPPQCRQLHTVATLPMLKGWACFNLHSFFNPWKWKKKSSLVTVVYFIEGGILVQSIMTAQQWLLCDSPSVNTRRWVHQAYSLLHVDVKPSSNFPGTDTYEQ